MAAVPVLQNGLVHGSRVDIILTTQNMVSVGEYNPLPYDELVDGKFLFQVDKVVMKSNRQIHVIRTFTPQQDCMALSVSKGPGQEKVFEIFADYESETMNLKRFLLTMNPKTPSALPDIR